MSLISTDSRRPRDVKLFSISSEIRTRRGTTRLYRPFLPLKITSQKRKRPVFNERRQSPCETENCHAAVFSFRGSGSWEVNPATGLFMPGLLYCIPCWG